MSTVVTDVTYGSLSDQLDAVSELEDRAGMCPANYDREDGSCSATVTWMASLAATMAAD